MNEHEAPRQGDFHPADERQPDVGKREVLEAILVDDRPRRARRRRLPILLFLVTCFTTYAAGCYGWSFNPRSWFISQSAPILVQKGDVYVDAEGRTKVAAMESRVVANWRDVLKFNWKDGLVYMGGVMLILLFHEMGHFIMTLRYKVPASFPFFIPMPFMVTGTMGAVIGMDPRGANRKQVFDIGLAGPLAGLVLTIPLLVYGLSVAEPVPQISASPGYGDPLLVKMLIPILHDLEEVKTNYAKDLKQSRIQHNLSIEAAAKVRRIAGKRISVEDWQKLESGNHEFTFMVNPIYMAAWVGMLVTGLNMLPISQLDGGHVSYALLGRHAYWLARAFLLVAIAFIVWTDSYNWTLMLILVLLIGIDHPPTADDTVKLGPWRYAVGLASLAIPIFCFTPYPLITGG